MARRDPRPSAEQMRLTLLLEVENTMPIPSARWIRGFVSAMKPPDPDEMWSIGGADPEMVPLVLPVLAAAAAGTKGRVRRLTNREATLVHRIRRGAGDLPLIDVYDVAQFYIVREAREAQTDDLDQFLSWAPWRDDLAYERYIQAVADGWIDGPLFRDGEGGELRVGWPAMLTWDVLGPRGHLLTLAESGARTVLSAKKSKKGTAQ